MFTIHVKDQDVTARKVIIDGPHISMKIGGSVKVVKIEDEYTQNNLANVSNNYKAMNIICCALGPNEFDVSL